MRKSHGGISKGGALLAAHIGVIYLFLFLPIIVLAVMSFNDSQAVGLPWRGTTTKWYAAAFANKPILASFVNSAGLGILVAVLATSIGTLAALAIRRGVILHRWLEQLILLPLITPGIVAGLALFMGFSFLGLPKTLFGSALIGHVTFTIPYVFLLMSARLRSVDKSLEEAAADLGASPFVTFRRVIYPLIRPAVLGSALLTFLLSFDEFIRTFFLVGLERTLPMMIWDLLFDALTPEIPAVMTMLLAFNVVVLLVGQSLLRRK